MERFPLHWPAGWPRTPKNKRQKSRFDVSWIRAIKVLLQEINRLGAIYPIISSDCELRNDGLPYANETPDDSGVAVWFQMSGEQRCIPCDKYETIKENIWAIAKTIDAMRGIERWGTGEMLKRTLHAFDALPPPGKTGWSEILGVSSYATLEECEAAYREQARKAHPDFGGSSDAMAALNKAIDAARREKKVAA